MTLLEYTGASRSAPGLPRDSRQLSAVLCGSFRRSPALLRKCFDELGSRFLLLSPRSVDFVDLNEEFVRLPHELTDPVHVIEALHLSALKSADFIWLHAPDGYVGPSAAMEIGQARALGVPVFTIEPPSDPVMASSVVVVAAMTEICPALLTKFGTPGLGLERLQRYYKTVAERRGWSNESARDTLLLLTEELGELARSIRKLEGLSRHQPDAETQIGQELADIQLYLVHLANGLGLDLARAVTDKDQVNAERFDRTRVA